MFFDYKFWYFLTRPHDLGVNLQSSSMRKLNSRIGIVFLLGAVLFVIRNIWGMNTEGITSVLATMTDTNYTIARYASLAGSVIWSVLYMAFHIFGIALVISQITKIPYQHVVPLQIGITGILLMEKALLFLVFYLKGATVPLSFLSFGPLAVTIMENWYIILFLNQLTVTTALIITLQYRFIRAFKKEGKWREQLWMLIGLHVAMALITASIAFIPFDRLLNSLFGGGF